MNTAHRLFFEIHINVHIYSIEIEIVKNKWSLGERYTEKKPR